LFYPFILNFVRSIEVYEGIAFEKQEANHRIKRFDNHPAVSLMADGY
jgi:hypothetical protein